MDFSSTPIEGLKVITPQIFKDNRGYFFESYNKQVFSAAGITTEFVQDNQSFSTKGVLRGLHFQRPPFAQAKLVRVLQGKVLDVAVDLRHESPMYGKWFGVELSDENGKMFFIPHGFAHGFSVLSETAVFAYKCDNFYNKESEGGLIYNDPGLAIDWQVTNENVSHKDLLLKTFKDYKENPCF